MQKILVADKDNVKVVEKSVNFQVKEEKELAVGCGFHLAHRDREPVVRHLGLQLLEHVIKYRWNDLSVQQKVYIKVSSFVFVFFKCD